MYHSALEIDPTARDIDRRASLEDNGIAGSEREITTVRRQLPDIALHEIRVTGDIGQRCSDPALAVVSPGLENIDVNGLTAQHAVALEGRIGQFWA